MRVFVAERSAEDIAILHRCTRDAGSDIEWAFARDGEEALEWLSRAAHDETRRPDVILLAINLPKLTGLEVLMRLQQTPQLCRIPAVVYTGSTREEDRTRAYDAGARLVVEKSAERSSFCELVQTLERVRQAPVAV